MKERISSFIIACALVFSCVAIPFITRPVPASATGVEGMLSWEYMMHLWALQGLFTHDSANYYGGFQGYTDEQKSKAMSGLKDFYDGQTRDLKNWLVVGKGIAEAKVNEWWNNLKAGTLDLVGDVGSAVYDWLNSKSGEVAKQWSSNPINENDMIGSDGFLSPSSVASYLDGYLSSVAGTPIGIPVYVGNEFDSIEGFMVGKDTAGYVAYVFWAYYYPNGKLDYRRRELFRADIGDKYSSWYSNGYTDTSVEDIKALAKAINGVGVFNDKLKEKVDVPLAPTIDDLENQKQLPSVIDTYGGNLPKPYRDPNNDDDGDGKNKPVPYVPQPIKVPWRLIHGDGDGSGGVKIIIKDTDINSIKQFNYNEYKKLQVQIQKLSQTLNKILNLKQYNIKNNTEIGGKGKVLPFIQPDFHQAIDFKKKFPFSLPWDVLYIFKLFNSTPEAPAVTIDYPVISKGSGWGGYTVTTKPIVVDFNTDIWNKVAKVCRVMLFLLFAVGICWSFFVK